MNLVDLFVGAWHAHPVSVPIMTGALLTLIIVAIYLLLKKHDEKNNEFTRKSIYLGEALKAIKYAENIEREKITSASLLNDINKAVGERETSGIRKTWKSVERSCAILTNCNTTLKNLERLSEEIAAGEVTYGQLGIVDVTFNGLVDYFRDNFLSM